MTQAERYLELMQADDLRDLMGCDMPKPVWRRFYGTTGRVDRRTGERETLALYLGFADGSRVRNIKGGDMVALPA